MFAADRERARKKIRRFQEQLPPTTSQIARVAELLVKRPDLPNIQGLEPFLLAAIAEAAISDGDLRTALEEVLGRSLHFAGLDSIARDELLAAAEARADQVRARNGDPWVIVAYRTGLKGVTCNAIRDLLRSFDTSQLVALGADPLMSPQKGVPSAPEVDPPRSLSRRVAAAEIGDRPRYTGTVPVADRG